MTPSMRELIEAKVDEWFKRVWSGSEPDDVLLLEQYVTDLCTEAVRRAVQYQYPWIHQHPTTLDHVLAAVMGDPAPEGEKR